MDNKTKLQIWGIKDLYYYGGFEDGSRATVCLILNSKGELEARGISLCSPQDQFVKRTGRAIALGRAVKALTHAYSYFPINLNGGRNEAICFFSPAYKASFHPQPTPYEVELIKKAC